MKYLLVISLALLLFTVDGFGQDSVPDMNKTIYSFVPQYLFKNGIRIDIEKQLKNQHFIQICPVFYLSEKDEDDNFVYDNNSYTNLFGAGMHLHHKYFVAEDFKKNPLYISYGLNYNYFEIDYLDEYLDETILANASIHKMGFDVTIGYQYFIKDVLSIDVFTGLGTRYAIMETTGDDTNRFNEGFLGYNYTGNLLLLGIRLGIKL